MQSKRSATPECADGFTGLVAALPTDSGAIGMGVRCELNDIDTLLGLKDKVLSLVDAMAQ